MPSDWRNSYMDLDKKADKMTLQIDRDLFVLQFGLDPDYAIDFAENQAWLDRQTGEILFVIPEIGDEDVDQAILGRVADDPERYLEIPHTDHIDDHHAILQEFLVSAWTEDDERREHAAGTYEYVGHSIGRWRKEMEDEDTWHAFSKFRDDALLERATTFLRQHGVEPEWV